MEPEAAGDSVGESRRNRVRAASRNPRDPANIPAAEIQICKRADGSAFSLGEGARFFVLRLGPFAALAAFTSCSMWMRTRVLSWTWPSSVSASLESAERAAAAEGPYAVANVLGIGDAMLMHVGSSAHRRQEHCHQTPFAASAAVRHGKRRAARPTQDKHGVVSFLSQQRERLYTPPLTGLCRAGGFGKVYKALRNGVQEVAVKMLTHGCDEVTPAAKHLPQQNLRVAWMAPWRHATPHLLLQTLDVRLAPISVVSVACT